MLAYLETIWSDSKERWKTSRSADLTDDTAVTLLNEVPEDSRVLHWHVTDSLAVLDIQTLILSLSVCALVQQGVTYTVK